MFKTKTVAWDAGVAFVVALLIYGFAAGNMRFEQSLAPHYTNLADSLLQGRLNLTPTGNFYDLLDYQNKVYLSSPPLPAVLMLPLVLLGGMGFSDILFSIVLGALNVGLVQRVFRNGWLTALFAFGTPHLYFSTVGTVWFQAQSVAIGFGVLTVFFAWRKGSWGWAGICWACAILARPTLAFGTPIVLMLLWAPVWVDGLRSINWRFFAPLVAAVGIYAVYNFARFGSPTDFGYSHIIGAPNLSAAIEQYGSFHPYFAWCNGFVMLALPPQILGYIPPDALRFCGHLLDGLDLESVGGFRPNPLGMSLLLATPAFLLLAWAQGRHRLIIGSWLGLIGVMVPIVLLHNTGSLQFGYRYFMDASPMWLLLLAIVLNRSDSEIELPALRWVPQRGLAATLIVLSVLINIWGFLWLFGEFTGAPWPG